MASHIVLSNCAPGLFFVCLCVSYLGRYPKLTPSKQAQTKVYGGLHRNTCLAAIWIPSEAAKGFFHCCCRSVPRRAETMFPVLMLEVPAIDPRKGLSMGYLGRSREDGVCYGN